MSEARYWALKHLLETITIIERRMKELGQDSSKQRVILALLKNMEEILDHYHQTGRWQRP